MRNLKLLVAIIFLQSAFQTHAQQLENDTSIGTQNPETPLYQNRRNLLKFNLTSIAFGNYQFQAERVLTRVISISFTYANIPEGSSIPFRDQILKRIDEEDEELVNMLNAMSVGYISYIPEVRFYLGKGFGKGIYLAPFYKHSKYNIENAEILEFERDDGTFEMLVTAGDISANTFGVLLGTQMNFGQRIVLDWWIMGPNFGTHSGELSGIPSRPLSVNEQQLLKTELEDINIPLSETTIEISSEGVEMANKGNWGGVRAGFNLGVRF